MGDIFNNSKVLITGGAGFIGSNLAIKLVDLGARVEIFDSLIPEQGGNLHNLDRINEKIKFTKADIRDEKKITQSVKDKDFLFNLAAYTSHEGSMKDPFTDFDINCRGNLVLLEACRKSNPDIKIIYTGTRGQYGKIIYTPVDEKHPINPTDANGISKTTGEMYNFLFHNFYGLKVTSLRLTNIYGPRHFMKNEKLGFVNWFIRLAMDNKKIKIFDGSQIRDLNFIDDVVQALLMVAINKKTNGEIFNLGSGKPISILDLTKLIIKIARSGSYEQIPYPKERKKIEIGDYVANFNKIKNLVGWKPKTPLEEGLKKTIEFYRLNKKNYW
jgi:nucleoside-diphosphate-sugar epimerase